MSSSSPVPATPNIAKARSSISSPNPKFPTSSPRDRVNGTLDGARARKLAMEDGASGFSNDSAPASPRAALLHGESSADEETSIVRRGSARRMDYQSTQIKSGSEDSMRRKGRGRQGGEGDEQEEVDNQQGWWATLVSQYGSIELENKGSVARDHLALERTFLAWLRTSLAFASIGIAITQLFRLNVTAASSGGTDPYKHLRQMGKPLGATFLAISIVMLFVGFHRYFEGQHWIIRGKFPASRGSIALVAAITFALMITSLVVVVVVEPGSFEKR